MADSQNTPGSSPGQSSAMSDGGVGGPFMSGHEYNVSGSSNVTGGSYNPNDRYLEIGYKNGNRYGYHDVSPTEAMDFHNAPSKGKWVWQNLRVPGTVFGFKKSYSLIAGSSSGPLPKYYHSDIHREEHRNIGPAGNLPSSWLRGDGPYDKKWASASAPDPDGPQHPMSGASPHFFADRHPMGKDADIGAITHRKVPLAYNAPAEHMPVAKHAEPPEMSETLPMPKRNRTPPSEVGTPTKAGGWRGWLGKAVSAIAGVGVGIGSLFGGHHMDQGGNVPGSPGVGENEDNVPIKATKGEFVVNKEAAQDPTNAAILAAMNAKGTNTAPQGPGHFAMGGLLDSLGDAATAGVSRTIGGTIGGYLGFGGGAIGATLGGLFGSNAGAAAAGGGGGSQSPMVEAAAMLKDAAQLLKDYANQINPQGPQPYGPANPFTNQATGKPYLQGMSPLMNPPGGGGPGAGAGGLADAAGPAGLAIAAALALNKVFDTVADSLKSLDKYIIGTAEGFAQMVGVPKSIAELGGAALELASPFKAAEIGVKALQFAILPLLNLDKPGEIVKDVLGGIANVGSKLITVFLDMRDPVGMLSGVIGPFVTNVGKFNPATIERMNFAFDNLGASVGKIFEPIVLAVTGFADELNQAYTAIGPPIRALVSDIAGMGVSIGREVFASLFSILQEGVPVVRGFIEDLKPLAPVGRQLLSGFTELASFAIRTGGAFFHGVMGFVEPLIPVGQKLFGIFSEGVRVVGTIWGALTDIGSAIASIAGASNAADVFKFALDYAVGTIQLFTSAVAGAAEVLKTIGESPQIVTNPIAMLETFFGGAQASRDRMNSQAQAGRLPGEGGPRTYAAQQARQVGIEEVGLEARRNAFSMGGTDPATQTAANTQIIANTAAAQLALLERMFPGIARMLQPSIVSPT